MNIKYNYQLHPLESLFESFFAPVVRKEFKQSCSQPSSFLSSSQNNDINISIEQNLLKLEVLVPGLSKRDLELSYSEGAISLTSKIPPKVPVDISKKERDIDMKIELPKEWNLSSATANVKDGILVIHIPRKEIEKRIIKIA